MTRKNYFYRSYKNTFLKWHKRKIFARKIYKTDFISLFQPQKICFIKKLFPLDFYLLSWRVTSKTGILKHARPSWRASCFKLCLFTIFNDDEGHLLHTWISKSLLDKRGSSFHPQTRPPPSFPPTGRPFHSLELEIILARIGRNNTGETAKKMFSQGREMD